MKRVDDGRSAPFAERFRVAVEKRDVTLVWLRDRLAESGNSVSLTTLSYWRSGRRTPEGASSMVAIAQLEMLLGLEVGELTDALGSSRRPGPVADPVMPEDDAVVHLAAEETFRALGAAPNRHLRDLTTHLVADVDAEGNLRRARMRTLLQATSGTIREIPYVWVKKVPSRAAIDVVDSTGVRATRRFQHPSGRVDGVVLELTEPLTTPATAMIEFTHVYPTDYPERRQLSHGMGRKARETIIWARFHQAAVPTWCQEYTDTDVRDLVLWGRSAHVVRRGYGPGFVGIRWGFDESGHTDPH